MPSLAQRVRRIARDRAQGASGLAREALEAMGLAAQESQADTPTALLQELEGLAQKLAGAHPSMAPIANYLELFLHHLREEEHQAVEILKNAASLLAQSLIDQSQEASLRAAEKAQAVLTAGDRVITASYSATVCLALEKAREQGKTIEVLAARSRWRGKSYGEAVAQRLSGLPVIVIPDTEIGAHIHRASKALVGADSLRADGSLINGTPTLEVARCAQKARLPFYVLCELSKCLLNEPGPVEEGFDLTPVPLITAVITERGISTPEEAWRQARALFRP